MTVGVLEFQGSVEEHIKMLEKLNVNVKPVKTAKDLDDIDGIILPGGESTTISKLLKIFEVFEPLKSKIEQGMPVWGTCAGMILLAKHIVGEQPHLSVMDITVRRNAYGRQLESFVESALISEISSKEIPLKFIRAPWVESVGDNVKVLYSIDGHIVAARENNILVTSFHPEITNDLSVHKYFVNIIENSIK